MKLKSKALLALLTTLPFAHPSFSMEEGFEKETPKMNLMAHLPLEISQEILDYLPVSAATSLGMTSHEMRALTEDDQYWRHRGEKQYGQGFIERGEKIGNDRTWKDIFAHFKDLDDYDHFDKAIDHPGWAVSVPFHYVQNSESRNLYRNNHSFDVRYNADKRNFLAYVSQFSSESIEKERAKRKKRALINQIIN